MSIISQPQRALIIPALQATAKREALRELAAAACQRYPQLDPEQIRRVLEEREELGSTAIGDEVAIPHGKIVGLEEMVLICGRSEAGVSYGAADGRPVHLIFLLLAPFQATNSYLSRLAELARFLRQPQVRSRLLQATSREEIAAILAGDGK